MAQLKDTLITGSARVTGSIYVPNAVFNNTNAASGTANNWPALIVGGTAEGAHIEMDGSNIMAKASDVTTATLYLNKDGGIVEVGKLDTDYHIFNSNVVINSKNGSYCEGLRVNRSTTGFANIYLGTSRDSITGSQTGGWWIGTLSTPANQTATGSTITNTVFTISNATTADTLSIKGTRGATIGTNSGWAIRPRLAVGTTYQTDYTFYVNGTSYFNNTVNITSAFGSGSGNAILKITNSTAAASLTANLYCFMSGLVTNMIANSGAYIILGKAATAKNAAIISYRHVADGNDGNYIAIGPHTYDSVLKIYGSGQVEITTTTSSTSYSTGALLVNGGLGVAENINSFKRIWAGVDGDTTQERQVGVRSGAGSLYLYSVASTTGSRGLYTPAHGTGAARNILYLDTNNETFMQKAHYCAVYIRSASESSSRYKRIHFEQFNAPRSLVGVIQCDAGNATNITTPYFSFWEYSGNSTADANNTGYYESYSLPSATKGLTENKSYHILTTKNTVTIAQGGTGQTTSAGIFTDISWSAGTTEGPTLGCTILGTTRTAKIDCAATDKSGVINTTTQSFAGAKTFTDNVTITGVTTMNGNVVMNSSVATGALTAASLVVNGNTTLNNTANVSTLLPHTTNTYNLGASGNRFAKLYLGDADSYGNSTTPIYWNAGVPKACDYTLSAKINSSSNANRIAYYSGTNAISAGAIVTEGNYLSNITYLTVNADHQTSYRFKVSGTSYLAGNTTIDGNLYLTAEKYVYMNYNGSNWDVITNYNNGNIGLNAAGLGLYIGYKYTPATYIYYTTADNTTRTLFFTVNNNGAFASTRFGVNGQSTSYVFYANGTSYLNGAVLTSGDVTIDKSAPILKLKGRENGSYLYFYASDDSFRGGVGWVGNCDSNAYLLIKSHSDTSYIRFYCGSNLRAYINGQGVHNAVWNDFAEYRKATCKEPGRVVVDDGFGCLHLCEERLAAGARIISDTYGCSVGQSLEQDTPIGVGGRVLVYPTRDRKDYHVGDSVCAGPNGTADVMTREEIIQYPDRIIGIVSEIPTYDIWVQQATEDSEPICHKVKDRIWVYVR